MGVELLEIGVKVRKGVIFIIRGCYRSVFNHPFLVGMICFLIFLYRSSPFIFQLLVSASPVLVCTALLLGTLLSFGQPNIPEIDIEEKKSGVLGDTTAVEENEGNYVDRFSENRWNGSEKPSEQSELLSGKLCGFRREEDSDATAPLIEGGELRNGEKWGAKRELGGLRYEEKTEWIEERLHKLDVGVELEHHSSDEEKSEADSFVSENEDDEASDCGSDHASMADIMPMLDELHPFLDEASPQSDSCSDAVSEKSVDDLEAADDENEDGEDAQGDRAEETKTAITWTEEDQRNLMDLGSSEIERNLRLENLISKRRATKNTSLLAERDLIDLDSSDLPFNIAPISTRRQNPFDLPHDCCDTSGLPPIPGSAPSVLLPRRNPFDSPYDSTEEKPDFTVDGFREEFTSQSRESFFTRHDSFNVGPMRPYFVPERTVSEESSSYLFQRQSSEVSDSKVSSIPETESITSADDMEDQKLPDRDSLSAREAVWTTEVTEDCPSGESELIFGQEIETEEDEHQETEMISKMESVSEHVGHGSESSEEEDDSLELDQVEKRDVQVGESQYVEVQGHRHGSDFEAVEPRYSRVSSSSSLSEVSESEGEGLLILDERRDHDAEEPTISSQTSLGSTLVNNISQRAPVYDSSPTLSKNVSSSSIASDVLIQFDLGFAPVLDKIIVSSIGSESEGSSREIETDNVNIDLSGSSSEALMEEHLMEKHILDEVYVSFADNNIHTLVRSSENHDPKQLEERLLLQSGKHHLTEASETQFDEFNQSPNYDADIQHETDEKMLTSMLVTEEHTSLFYDHSIQEPDFNYLNGVQAPSAPFESRLDDQITWDFNMPQVQELDRVISPPLSQQFVSAQPSAFEMNSTSTVDVQTVDCVELESLSSTHHAETSTTRSTEVHSVEVNQKELLLHSEESRDDCIYEQDLDHISEASRAENIEVSRKEIDENDQDSPYQETLPRENKVLPAHSFVNHNHEDTIYGMPEFQGSSIEDIELAIKQIRSKESEKHFILDDPSQPELQDHEDTVSTVPTDSMDDASVETKIVVGVTDIYYQGQVDMNTTSGMTELEARTVEDDESVKVKADDKIGPSREKWSTKESNAFEEELNHEAEAPIDLQSTSSVKGKGSLSRSPSSSSSSNSDSSSSDPNRE